MTSKLPVRRNIAPFFNSAKVERTLNLKNDKIYQQFSANFDGNANMAKINAESVDATKVKSTKKATVEPTMKLHEDTPKVAELKSEDEFERVTRKNWKSMLQEKDDHIDQLVAHLDELHTHNTRFAAENDRLLNQSCESCEELQRSVDELRTEREHQLQQNQQLLQDVRMMKTLVYRLNVQLERHQDELRKIGAADGVFCNADLGAIGNPERVVDWGSVHVHTLGPLLQAYSEMISEKRDLVQQYEQELALFTGRLKDVLAENERLHNEMDELRHDTESWTTDKTRMQAQLDIFRNKAEIQSKRADLAKEKLVEVLRCYEQKVQSQHLDLERLQEAYSRSKGELTAIRGMQQNPEVVVDSLKECQRLFEELKIQHDSEKTKIQAECETLRQRLLDADEKYRKDREELLELRASIKEKTEQLENLTKKNGALRQSLGRVRLSRESFRNKLKTSNNVVQKVESGQQRIQNNWEDANNAEQLLRQKENQVQSLHARYVVEIEKLSRKLQQRDETLKRVLQAKVKSNVQKQSSTKNP